MEGRGWRMRDKGRKKRRMRRRNTRRSRSNMIRMKIWRRRKRTEGGGKGKCGV